MEGGPHECRVGAGRGGWPGEGFPTTGHPPGVLRWEGALGEAWGCRAIKGNRGIPTDTTPGTPDQSGEYP